MKNVRNTIIEITETFAVSFVIIMILYGVVASVEVVSGASMEPNFHTNERILVDKITPIFDTYKRGDVVVFIPPNDRKAHYIKRIISLPGETIKIYNCKVYVIKPGSKYLVEEAYLFDNLCTTGGTVVKDGRSLKIPEGQYLLLGDNRPFSIDSRYIGLVRKDKILGRVVFKFWPISEIGFTD
jgi:signal peptidase I